MCGREGGVVNGGGMSVCGREGGVVDGGGMSVCVVERVVLLVVVG